MAFVEVSAGLFLRWPIRLLDDYSKAVDEAPSFDLLNEGRYGAPHRESHVNPVHDGCAETKLQNREAVS